MEQRTERPRVRGSILPSGSKVSAPHSETLWLPPKARSNTAEATGFSPWSFTTAEFKTATIKDALKLLDATEGGLSEAEAAKRAALVGFNEVPQKKKNELLELLLHFWGPIAWLMEIAVILTIMLGDVFDSLIILFLLVVNGTVSFFNERDSQKALELLKTKLTIKARVLRNGKWDSKSARELVPGDIIIIGLGDVVPADAKILHGFVSADQSSLTGESLPVDLKEGDVLYTGSIIKRGEVKCAVVNTGMRTYFGKTVELVNIAKPKSRQEEVVFQVSRYLIYVGALMFLIILLYSLKTDVPLFTIATFAVLFIGGGVPAALPVMFTIAQAKGATELSKQNILVTKLDSIENAASVEILCLDKTGTITLNELHVSDAIPFGNFKKEELLALASLASSAESKDAIDSTVIDYAKKCSAKLAGYKQLSYTPFEPATKRAEGLLEFKGKRLKAVKGAPQMVLSLCKNISKAQKDEANKKINELSLKGCRVLAVAKSDLGKYEKLTLVGLLALSDPLRPDSRETIAALREVGIKPIMLTGDNIAVAREMAKQAGIGEKIVRISEIKSLPQKEQAKAVENCDGIAEIYPEDKFWVVKLLQSHGHMVGMTGDGVNDAPALKQAELGIAVSSSTDVAKAAASMVLTEPGTKVILEAVRTSRETYQRVLTWTLKKIIRSIQFMLILTVGFFMYNDIIVSITGLMLLVIVNDFLSMSLALDNARATKSPNNWNLFNIGLTSLILGLLFFFIEYWLLRICIDSFHYDLSQIQSLMLLSLVYTGQLGILIVRERGHFWQSMPCKEVLITTLGAVIVFTLMGVYGLFLKQLPAEQIGLVLAISIGSIIVIDWPKYYTFKKLGIS